MLHAIDGDFDYRALDFHGRYAINYYYCWRDVLALLVILNDDAYTSHDGVMPNRLTHAYVSLDWSPNCSVVTVRIEDATTAFGYVIHRVSRARPYNGLYQLMRYADRLGRLFVGGYDDGDDGLFWLLARNMQTHMDFYRQHNRKFATDVAF